MLQNKAIAPLLFIYHGLWTVVAYFYIIKEGGDATRYWWIGTEASHRSWMLFLQPGTEFIKALTYPLAKVLHWPLGVGFALFSLWSFWGWYLLLKIFQQKIPQKRVWELLAIAFLFSPNQHFWTALLGKEAVLWTPIILLIAGLGNRKINTAILWCSLLVILWIRPHMGAIIGGGIGLYLLWKTKRSPLQKAMMIGGILIMGMGTTYLLNSILEGNGSVVQKIGRYYEAYNQVLQKTNAYVPLEEYSFPYKLITFYARPMLGEGEGWIYAMVGLENFLGVIYGMILLTLIVITKNKLQATIEQWCLWGIGLGLTIMYVYAYANFGLILRTKAVLLPWFIIPVLIGWKRRSLI